MTPSIPCERRFVTFFLMVLAVLMISLPLSAHTSENVSGVQRQFLSADALPNIPDHKMTSVIVELKPGMRVGAHQHDAFVYAYVLEGRVRSQLNDGKVIEYQAGDVWVEPPKVVHTLTENISDTQIARLLVIFVAKGNARLSTSIKH